MATTQTQKNYNQTFSIMLRIHREMEMAKKAGVTQANMMEIRKNLNLSIDYLKLEKDRKACRMMMEAILCNFSSLDHTLVYIHKGKRYSVRDNTPNCEPNGTHSLHEMDLKSSDWDAMDKETVWQESGKFYCKTFL